MNDFTLKPNLLLGTVCVPTQIDGGDVDSCWKAWAAAGMIRDGSDPARAAGHWERWREDVLLMHGLGVQSCRLGVDWARLEPEEGRFDEEALDHFKEELMLLIGMGVRPLVTLHQCSDPAWFTDKGGWEKQDNILCFLIYVERVVRAIGHLTSEYVTLCEPNAYAYGGWLFGTSPPGGKKRLNSAANVMSNLCTAHIRAYRLIHDVRRSLGFSDSRVGFMLDYRVFTAQNRFNPVHRAAAAQRTRLYQEVPAEAMLTGEYRAPLRAPARARKGTYADFHAVTYGGRFAVSHLTAPATATGYRDDLGRGIQPEGLTRVCLPLLKLRPMALYVSAGTCDVNDSFRCRYIYDLLKLISESKLPVKRFYYDGFLDGMFWSDGCYARCGLVYTDFETLERTVKRSGEFYAKCIRRGGVSEKMYDKYVAEEEYHL